VANRLLKEVYQKATMTTRRLHSVPFRVCATLVLASSCSALAQSTNVWTNALSGSWHAPANWSLGAAPVFTNSFVLISNFNSKTITADATTPVTNLYLRNLTLGALQNRQNTLVLTNLVAPFDITRGFTISSGGALQIYSSTVRVDGANAGQMAMTAASATLNSGAVLLTNGASLKRGNGTGIAAVKQRAAAN
jgi:hypothetical protein